MIILSFDLWNELHRCTLSIHWECVSMHIRCLMKKMSFWPPTCIGTPLIFCSSRYFSEFLFQVNKSNTNLIKHKKHKNGRQYLSFSMPLINRTPIYKFSEKPIFTGIITWVFHRTNLIGKTWYVFYECENQRKMSIMSFLNARSKLANRKT